MTLSGGTSKAPSDPLIEDMTAAINKQVGLLKKNFTEELTFSFDFLRSRSEVEKVNKLEPEEKRFADAQAIVNLQYEKYQEDRAGTSYYHCKVRLNPKKALELLSCYDVSLQFSASRTYGEKDFPRRSDDPELPPAGVVSRFGHLPDPKTNQRVRGRTVPVLFSYQFKIKNTYYLPGDWANRDDFIFVRKALWHEIMECTILAIAAEALYMPRNLYDDYEGEQEGRDMSSRASFAQIAVVNTQRRAVDPRQESLFLYWEGDPPFDAFEVGGYTREADARRLEDDAIRLEGQGNWAGAREKWIEAEDAWERAIQAWEAVPRHPGREQRIKTARDRLTQVRKRKEVALWMAASWNVTSTSTGEINIRYTAWPVRFQAKIADVKGNVLAAFDKPSGTGVIIWGKDVEAGLYFIRVEAERVEPMVRKIVIL